MIHAPYYALYVLNEAKACKALREMGFEVYLPTYRRVIVRRGRAEAISAPLVQRYLFVRIPPTAFAEVKANEHVAYVVGSEGVPRILPEDVVYGIKQLAGLGRFDERLPPAPPPPKPVVKSRKRAWNKNRARGVRKRGLAELTVWFDEGGEAVREAA